jgi:hypothetical protein
MQPVQSATVAGVSDIATSGGIILLLPEQMMTVKPKPANKYSSFFIIPNDRFVRISKDNNTIFINTIMPLFKNPEVENDPGCSIRRAKLLSGFLLNFSA